MSVVTDLGYITSSDYFRLYTYRVHYFIFFNCWVIFYYVNIPHFPYPVLSYGYLDYFHFQAIMNRIEVHIDGQIQ